MNTKQKTVRVPLGPNGELQALIYADDLAKLRERYGERKFFATYAKPDRRDLVYVRFSHKGRQLMAARAILGSAAGRGIVRHLNGNTLDLRRDNLRCLVGDDERRKKREMKAMLAEVSRLLDRDIEAANPALAAALAAEGR